MVRPVRVWRALSDLPRMVTASAANVLKVRLVFGDARRKQGAIYQHACAQQHGEAVDHGRLETMER